MMVPFTGVLMFYRFGLIDVPKEVKEKKNDRGNKKQKKGREDSIVYESMKLFCKIMFRRFFCDTINIIRRVFIMERQKKPVYRVQIFKTKKNSKISL